MSVDTSHLYRLVKIDLANAHFYGNSWKSMADATGVSPSTIKKFATGETTRPSFHTVALLAGYAGHAVSISRLKYGNNLPHLRAVK